MAATAQLKSQIKHKSKRRKCRETVISTTASTVSFNSSSTEFPGRKHETTAVVESDGSWCCAPTKPFHSPSRRTSTCKSQHQSISSVALDSPSPSRSLSSSSYRIRVSPGRVSPIMKTPGAPLPPSCSKFNNALNGKLLSPIASSPPPQNADKMLCSPTLFEMMSHEQDCGSKGQITVNNLSFVPGKSQISAQEKQTLLQERVAKIVGGCSPGNLLNDASSSDVRVNLSSKDGLCISMNVHRQILMSNSKFFASKLSDHWSNIQKSLPPHLIEISDCDDIEIYVETLRLMYCKDIRKKLMREKVPKVLGILQVCSAIGFDVGVLSCLEYLEASPWAEDEEEKVTSALSQLHLSNSAEAEEVLKRVSTEIVVAEKGTNEETLLKLLQAVLQGKDEKARRDMKALISKMLRENTSQNDISMESLYFASHSCLQLLRLQLLNASSTSDSAELCQISRQADNLHWILGILIDRQIASDFVKIWADQTDLSDAHSKVPAIHRYEISKVTAKLFVAIGKAQVLASKEVRCMLLKTWLEPFYRDYGWMTRSCKGLDRHLIEDGLSNTVLTLPLSWQKEILLSWFKRFMNSSDDCPNLHRAFEGWWRRVFWRRRNESVQTPTLSLRFAMDHENSINLN